MVEEILLTKVESFSMCRIIVSFHSLDRSCVVVHIVAATIVFSYWLRRFSLCGVHRERPKTVCISELYSGILVVLTAHIDRQTQHKKKHLVYMEIRRSGANRCLVMGAFHLLDPLVSKM